MSGYCYNKGMKAALVTRVTPRINQLRDRFRRVDTPDLPVMPVMPVIHDDLGGLSAVEIAQEISVVKRRLELGAVAPEGADGLTYRLTRLQAQAKALQRTNKER